MAIIIDPNWSFEQALAAAWRAYPSRGVQYGVTNRIRYLTQWANVVGAEKAMRGLKDAARRGLLQEFSKYARRKLRDEFGRMPMRRVAEPPAGFRQRLQWVASQHYEHEIDFLAKAVLPLTQALGWHDDQVFFQKRLGGDAYADVVLASSRTANPRVVVEVKLIHYRPGMGLVDQMRDIMGTAGATYGVFLSPAEMVVFDEHGERAFDLATISQEASDAVMSMLRNPGTSSVPEPLPLASPAEEEFERLLLAVDSACTNDQQKKSLEELAASLLSGMPSQVHKPRDEER